MKDYLGNELKIGDEVIATNIHFADLIIGKIIRFTPKKVEIECIKSRHRNLIHEKQLKEPYQLYRISK